MFWKKMIACWHKFWNGSRTRDGGDHGRMIVERPLEMSKHRPAGTSPGIDDADERDERKEA